MSKKAIEITVKAFNNEMSRTDWNESIINETINTLETINCKIENYDCREQAKDIINNCIEQLKEIL